ncbi:MAG: hypothetical protein GY716_06660 [bacterium]|nr:hypothetical protein [bacterium]
MSDERMRAALRRATQRGDEDVDRLIESMPAIFAEAERRREAAAAPAFVLAAAGRAWLPRFAIVTALALVGALAWSAIAPREESTTPDEALQLDQWVVTGEIPEDLADPVLEALVR